MVEKNALIGKKVTAVWLASDKKAMRFDVADGEPIIARADGDCCSSTWIESLDMPALLIGTVSSVEDIAMPDLGNGDSECISYYGCRVTTDRGICVIDYRNESNGYYGGDLSWPGDSFYGGVYDQNVSNNDWKLIAGSDQPQ